MFEELIAKDPGNAAARLERSRLAAARGDYALARRLAVEAGKRDPRSQAALEQLAAVVADEEDAEALAVVVSGLQEAAPGSASTLYYAASLEFLKGNPPRAAELAAQAAALRPGDARVHNLAGAAYGALGRVDRARASFRAALEASPEILSHTSTSARWSSRAHTPPRRAGISWTRLRSNPLQSPRVKVSPARSRFSGRRSAQRRCDAEADRARRRSKTPSSPIQPQVLRVVTQRHPCG